MAANKSSRERSAGTGFFLYVRNLIDYEVISSDHDTCHDWNYFFVSNPPNDSVYFNKLIFFSKLLKSMSFQLTDQILIKNILWSLYIMFMLLNTKVFWLVSDKTNNRYRCKFAH